MGRIQEFLDTELLLTELFALQLVEVCCGCSSRSHVSCRGAVDGAGHAGELLADCSSAALDMTQPTGADAGWGDAMRSRILALDGIQLTLLLL